MNKMSVLSKILKAFLAPVIVLLIHIILLFLGLYSDYEWIDIPMHFLGGFAVAITFVLLLKLLQEKKLFGRSHWLVFFVFIISLVCLIAVLWEFSEFILDKITHFNIQLSVADTLSDLLFGLLGGIFGFAVFYPKALR